MGLIGGLSGIGLGVYVWLNRHELSAESKFFVGIGLAAGMLTSAVYELELLEQLGRLAE